MEVTVTSTATVRPARPTPRRALWCSDLDQLFAGCIIPTVYFYRPLPDGSSPGCFFDASVMKAALAEVLVPFYPAAGRIKVDCTDGRLQIDCNGEGVAFVEAESNVGLDEFGDFGFPENETKYAQLVPQAAAFGGERDIPACPLLLFQVTRFRCGGVSLGVSFNHLLGDGLSAIHLINSWANTAARVALPDMHGPFLDRTALAARNPPAPSFPHPGFHAPPSMGTNPPPNHDQPFVAASFTLTAADITRLKSKGVAAAAEGGRCSVYEATAAHVWRCACIARELPAGQDTLLYMPLSILRRLHPPLPLSYLGNAVFMAVCDATAREVTGEALAVEKVQAALARWDDAYVRSALDYLHLKPDMSNLGAHIYGSPNLNVTSWVQMPVYGADFGWGRPVFMGPARLLFEGMVIVLPRPAADDGLTVVVGLLPAAIQRFKNVFYDF